MSTARELCWIACMWRFRLQRLLALRQADSGDIEIYTLGANLTQIEALGPGKLDLLVWAATQFGDWRSQSQDSWAYALELGYPSDGEHATFFQLLPTARLYALVRFYNLMNNRDRFGQLILRPHPMVAALGTLHWLRVSEHERDDLHYSGGGATSNSVFGCGLIDQAFAGNDTNFAYPEATVSC